jgi:hypothetical protein
MDFSKVTSMSKFTKWFFAGNAKEKKIEPAQSHWFKVMCLTGLDYFSTIGFQPGIAFIAAGILSPFATLVLVLVTLFGAVPVYMRVAKESPHGQGSIAMLERLLPGWQGKTLVLVLLGFAATDFVITMTLCAADATTHLIENPFIHNNAYLPFMQSKVGVTLVLLTLLGALFLNGFSEAIGVAVALVCSYLLLNTILLVPCLAQLINHPELTDNWWHKLAQVYHSPLNIIGLSLVVFPQLALGLSGFETGVAVMPLIKGGADDRPEKPEIRISNTGKLLVVSALIMTVLLVCSAFVTTVLIPAELFQPGGAANGRALAYLAHKYMGDIFGSVYDFSTILMLWFAGASAMAALLSLIPRYLPRYGMAPDWATAIRPLVVVFTVINIVVTVIFKADVDAQAGAFATGLLVLFTSAAFAVMLCTWRESIFKRIYFTFVFFVFIYTSVLNMIQRPEGLHISMFFIGLILFTSLVSRMIRSTELRVTDVEFDQEAMKLIEEVTHELWGEILVLSNRPEYSSSEQERRQQYKKKEVQARRNHSIQSNEGNFIFLEVELGDASDFVEDRLMVQGERVGAFRILRCTSPAIPNAVAAILIKMRDQTGKVPKVYMGWTEGHPLGYVFKYIFFGEGETAPITREILRSAIPDPERRPEVHVS